MDGAVGVAAHDEAVGIHFIIEMIRWTGLALLEFEFPFPGSLTSTFLSELLWDTRMTQATLDI